MDDLDSDGIFWTDGLRRFSRLLASRVTEVGLLGSATLWFHFFHFGALALDVTCSKMEVGREMQSETTRPAKSWAKSCAIVGSIWAVFGGFLVNMLSAKGDLQLNLSVYLTLFLLCLGDLMALTWLIKLAVDGASEEQKQKHPRRALKLAVLGLTKLGCLIGIGCVVVFGRNATPVSLVAGVSTLLVVPLISGVIADARTASF